MSGAKFYNFREGDRSEYLAYYLLSGISLTTPVPRQEDIGVDFYCQLSENESGILTFNHPFVVSVKSESVQSIVYGDSNPAKWRAHQIDWLSKLDWPLIFAFVDKKRMSLSLYNTSMFRFLEFTNKQPSLIEFKRRKDFDPRLPIHTPIGNKLEKWPAENGDGFMYTVDLGNPLITLSNSDIDDETQLGTKKYWLRKYFEMEQQNIVFKKLRIPYFQWPKYIWTNLRFDETWFHTTIQNESFISRTVKHLGPGLISLALNLKLNNREDLIPHIKPFIKELPDSMLSDALKEEFSYLFD